MNPQLSIVHNAVSDPLNPSTWLGVFDLSQLAEISESKARQALTRAKSGILWRDARLIVRDHAGQLQVRGDSLPNALEARWLQWSGRTQEPAAPVIALAAPDPDMDPRSGDRIQEAYFLLNLIRPALRHPQRTAERAAAIREIGARVHVAPGGKECRFGLTTLRGYLTQYERGGIEALARKPRSDRGQRRTQVVREWDRAMTGVVSDEARARVAETWTRYIRSLWRSGAAGWREVADMAGTRLAELTTEAAPQLPTTLVAALCSCDNPTGLRRRVEAERAYALVAKAEKDAKAFFDENIPRIRRTRAGLQPMDIIVGDVTPLDIYIDRPEDGEQATFKAISWLDLATNRLYVSLYLPPKGKGVTRLQVAASFADMVAAWGLPKRLYLDNGSEYNWAEMLGGFTELSRLARKVGLAVQLASDADAEQRALIDDSRGEIIRARAYNAPAKPIEGIFAVFGVILSMLPGYVGGNRMAKKSANLGKAPQSFPGSPREFLESFAVALNHYHNKPQSGSLGNKSPRAVYQNFLDEGWGRVDTRPETLLLAFADEETRTVEQGHLRWTARRGETLWYTHERLWALADSERRVRVRVARHDPSVAFIFPAGSHRLLCIATPDQAYSPLDVAGAKEQSARAGVLRRHVAERRQDCDLLDLVEEMHRSDSHKPSMPAAPVAATITPSGELAEMLAGLEQSTRALIEDARRKDDPMQLSQWSQERDPLLDALGEW